MESILGPDLGPNHVCIYDMEYSDSKLDLYMFQAEGLELGQLHSYITLYTF